MPRSKTPTIIDIAAAAGVSKSVVSRALSGHSAVSPDKRQRVQDAAERLGYVANAMARGLVSSRTRTIGVVLRDVRKPYYSYLQAGIQAEAERRDYRIVATTNAGKLEVEDALREITNLISLQVDGLVIAPARLPSVEYMPFAERLPIVVAGRRETTSGISSTAVDDYTGGRALAAHLLGLGHRIIAVLQVNPNYSSRYGQRGRGMLDELRAGGAEPIIWSTPTDLEAADIANTHLEDADAPTAIMCPTDAAAVDLLEVLRQRDAVTRYSVTGFDGFGPLAAPYLGLTTLRQPIEELGRVAVDLLLDQLDHGNPPGRFVPLGGTVVTGRTARPLTSSVP